MNEQRIELAANLAHNATVDSMSDLYSEEELWIEVDGNLVYKEDVQDVFNDHYDFYLGKIEEVIKDPKIMIIPAINVTDWDIHTVTSEKLRELHAQKKAEIVTLKEFTERFNDSDKVSTVTDFVKLL